MATILALGESDSTSVLDLYASLPLPRNLACIRVLDVHSDASPGAGGPISGNLRVVNLEHRPQVQFSALSYVWGVDVNPCTIACGNFKIEVTQNCYSCLLHLRKKLGNFTIWVDAVCINQKDDREKERQIPFMGNIYSSANITYVWLGAGNERSDRAMAYLARAGFVEFFSPTNPRVWAAFWHLCASSIGLTKHVYLVDGDYAPVSSRYTM
jgi:Heterokaryon incompatibility protein (HET)